MNYVVDDVILRIQICSSLVEGDNKSTLNTIALEGVGMWVEASNSISDPLFQHLLLFQRKHLQTLFCVCSFRIGISFKPCSESKQWVGRVGKCYILYPNMWKIMSDINDCS